MDWIDGSVMIVVLGLGYLIGTKGVLRTIDFFSDIWQVIRWSVT